MKKLLLIGAVLLTACQKHDKKITSATLPGVTTTPAPSATPINVLAAGQSNATLRINNTDGISTYFCRDMKIPCNSQTVAVGGSSQKDWVIGGTYYNNLISKAKANKPDVILWWQGEAEGMFGNQQDAQGWSYTFTNMVNALRSDLHQPTLPIIFCQIGTNPAGDHESGNGVYTSWKEVQDQQASVSLPNVYMVKSSDQDFYGFVHTDETGYRTIAARMANVYTQEVKL